MSVTGLAVFDTTVQTTNEWLREVMDRLGTGDRHRAYLALRVVLHALRDHLPSQEVIDLGAQLPMLVRGFYYEGWRPRDAANVSRHVDDLFARVDAAFKKDPGLDPEMVVRAVFETLSTRISEGEIEDVVSALPTELKTLWYVPVGD
jgi:uncharacterized protein (DUF2267 family)